MTDINWDDYPNFSEWEFACRGEDCCGGLALMDPLFMWLLQDLRTTLGFPFRIGSGYRCGKHNMAVNGGPAHPAGKAADITVIFSHAREIVISANAFSGIGVKQHGSYKKRFIHLDTLQQKGGLARRARRPTIWSY